MEKRRALRAALAIVAAVAGTGYASGRELVLFFAQTGWASWVGIPFASAVFGLLTALFCRWAGRCGATGFADFCRRLMGRRAAALASWLYGLLLALTLAVMLCGAGEIGGLALPLRHGWAWGAGLALLAAVLMNLSKLKSLPWLGLATLLAGVLFYGSLAVDARPIRVWLRGDVELALAGSWPAAILLALAYAGMNAALAMGIVLRFGGSAKPARVGLLSGAMLCALLACGNAALTRGGRPLLGQAMPSVILSARWGLFGFWACAGFALLCDVTTLAAALGGLIDLLRQGNGRTSMLCALALALCALGLRGMVGTLYPAVGWLSAVLMLILACRLDALLFQRPDIGKNTGANGACEGEKG